MIQRYRNGLAPKIIGASNVSPLACIFSFLGDYLSATPIGIVDADPIRCVG